MKTITEQQMLVTITVKDIQANQKHTINAEVFIRASIFTVEQEQELQKLKGYFPFRIVWGAINPQDQSFHTGADYDRRRINAALRKGWLVCTVG